MGFSVSGAAAIIFASMFIAFGMWFTATSNSFDRVTDAQDEQTESLLETTNTAIEIESATFDAGNETLTITAHNTGATTLSLGATDLLEDSAYTSGWQTDATVDGDATTDLWLPGDQLQIELDRETAPERVKLVTESSVEVSSEVTDQ